jgi:hypothetical protein
MKTQLVYSVRLHYIVTAHSRHVSTTDMIIIRTRDLYQLVICCYNGQF